MVQTFIKNLKSTFPFYSKDKKASSLNLSSLVVDVHSHLIPGIDDGAKNMQESLELIKELSNLGYRKLIITPHIMYDTYRNNSKDIIQKLDDLRVNISKNNLKIEIECAAEYYLDEHFIQLLKNKDILTFGSNYLLFETSYIARPYALHEQIFLMKSLGYKPVLAHPERYLYMHNDFKEYKRVKDMGVFFQINLNSLIGYYSSPVKKAVEWLVDNGLVDFAGSDTHKMRHIDFLKKVEISSSFQNLFLKNKLLNETLL